MKKESKVKKQFPCPKCDKIWNWAWELRRHLPIHEREQLRQETAKYKCDECDKRFMKQTGLVEHQRIHSGKKLLDCFECGKQFVKKQELMYHVVMHTGEKPFKCEVCDNRFTQPANLRTHKKKVHNISSSRKK